jgi:hypothetical protein
LLYYYYHEHSLLLILRGLCDGRRRGANLLCFISGDFVFGCYSVFFIRQISMGICARQFCTPRFRKLCFSALDNLFYGFTVTDLLVS